MELHMMHLLIQAQEPLTISHPSHTVLTDVAIVMLLSIAFAIDFMSIGVDTIRDKVAFLLSLPAIHACWADSSLDAGLTQGMRQLIEAGFQTTGTKRDVAQLSAAGIKCMIFFTLVYVIGVLVPNKWAAKAGKWATYSFKMKQTSRINYKLWGCSFILGVFGGQLGGLSGSILTSALDTLTAVTAGVPNMLIGQ
jgi:tetrahydromethanopterin S-methyltransferase subunit D